MTKETRKSIVDQMEVVGSGGLTDQQIMDIYLSVYSDRADYEYSAQIQPCFMAALASEEYHQHWSNRNDPALMTRREYVAAQTELDRVAKLEFAGSLHRVSELEAGHLRHIRNAIAAHRSIHVENWHEYRPYCQELARYSFNGNIAVFDSTKGGEWDKSRVHREAVAMSDALDHKQTRRALNVAPVCDMCKPYGTPGYVINAGQKVKCWQCNQTTNRLEAEARNA